MESTAETTSLERELTIDASPETVWEFLVASGEFVELDPPHRLVYTWGWEPGEEGENPVPPGSSTVEVELAPNGSGTLLRFRHHGLPDKAAAESHGHGWDHYLERLVLVAAGRDPWLSGQM